MTTETKTENGKKFIASQRAEYNRIALDIIAQYPITIGKIVEALEKSFQVETDKSDQRSAKITMTNFAEYK